MTDTVPAQVPHDSHVDAPANENEFVAHKEQLDDPERLNASTGHSNDKVAPAVPQNRPASQTRGADRPVELQKVPGEQRVKFAMPFDAQYPVVGHAVGSKLPRGQ
jgi:hypothetical protein